MNLDEESYEDKLSEKPLKIPAGTYTFVYHYPLTTKAQFQHPITPKTSIIDVLLLAKADYQAIYDAEESKSGNPGYIPGMLNRQVSKGPYGIWGHDMSDLYFEGVKVNTKKMTVTFSIGS